MAYLPYLNMNNKSNKEIKMSKEIIELSKGDVVKLNGTEYEITVKGASQVTMKSTKDGKSRRLSLKSSAMKNLEMVTKSENTEDVEEPAKKRVGKRNPKKEVAEATNDPRAWEKWSLAETRKEIDAVEEDFVYPNKYEIFGMIDCVKNATKEQRIAYINYKLAQKTDEALMFRVMLKTFKNRNNLRLNLDKFYKRVKIDEIHKGKRAKKLNYDKLNEAFEVIMKTRASAVTQEMMDDIIKIIPDDEFQGWYFQFMGGTATWSNASLGSLKLTAFELKGIKGL